MVNKTALIVALLALLPASAQTRADDVTRSVKVTGTTIAKVMPDTVIWTVNVTSTDANLKLAREENDETTREVLALRERLDIDAQDVQTGSLYIQKIYERDRSGNRGAFRHYQFRRTIRLRQRDTENFDDILQMLTGTKNIEASYSLESSDYHKIRRETRLKAVAVAKEKAAEMTELLDAKLGHVLTIDESVAGKNSFHTPHFASNSAYISGTPAQPDDVGGTFAPGAIEIRVSVDIEFAIE